MSFDNLGLHPLLVQAVTKAGYETPTSVQQKAIPEALAGRDLMVSSATGSGKTAAFMLPALQSLTKPSTLPGKGPRVVILTPTRELAMQVTQACEAYGRALPNLRTVSILGGVPYAHQQRLLRQYVDVMVATPGRLIDYMQRGMIDFSRVEILVLDEADRMLDMGFIEDIEHIVSKMPEARQTLMFSATFSGPIGRLAQEWLRDPLPITVATQRDTHENIEQRLHYTRGYSNKISVLEYLLKDASVNQAIVFTATQREADSLSEALLDQGFVSGALHGGMNQRQRNRTLQQMKQGRLRVLVATDVAARGLDVQGISHVINFDLPKMAEDYVHRIGRTGRAGRQGVALTLADIGERRHVQRIERFTTQRIPVHAIDGLAPIPDETQYPLREGSRRGSSSRNGSSRFDSRTSGTPRRSSGEGQRREYGSRGAAGGGRSYEQRNSSAQRPAEASGSANRGFNSWGHHSSSANGNSEFSHSQNRRSQGTPYKEEYKGNSERNFSKERTYTGGRSSSSSRFEGQGERSFRTRTSVEGRPEEFAANKSGNNGRRRREWNHSS